MEHDDSCSYNSNKKYGYDVMIRDIIKYMELYSSGFPYKKTGVTEIFLKPTEDDYKLKQVSRFFVKKINDARIIEVNYEMFGNINSDLYAGISAVWYISGIKNDVYINGKLQLRGVEDLNKQTIKKSEKLMPGIKNKLINPLQFYKP